MTGLWDYMIDEITHEINEFNPDLPPEFVEDVATNGLEWALDKTVNITAEFTGDYFDQELRGMSDASGIEFVLMQRIHMLGELTKVGCPWDLYFSENHESGHEFGKYSW